MCRRHEQHMMADADVVFHRDRVVEIGVQRRRNQAVGPDSQPFPNRALSRDFHAASNRRARPDSKAAAPIQPAANPVETEMRAKK